MEMLLVLGCPELTFMVPAVDGHKGLAPDGPYVQHAAGEMGL